MYMYGLLIVHMSCIFTWYKRGKVYVCMYCSKVRTFTLILLMCFSSLPKQESKPLGTIPLAGNKIIRQPDDPKLPNQYRFEIVST